MSFLIEEINRLENHEIQSILDNYSVPGCAIGIYGRHSKYFSTYGYRQEQLPVTEHTAFRVASLTKPVFAYLCLQYVIDGVLDLDTPLIEYYDERYVDDDRINELTIRKILSHQTGWPNWSYTKPLVFEFDPGTGFQYSGEGIIYLQRTLAHITDRPVFRLLQQNVYDKLEMNNSALAPEFLQTENRCLPHDKNGLVMKNRRQATTDMIEYINRMPRHGNAAGTMWSSIADYTTFLHHLIFSDDEQTSRIRELMLSQQISTGTDGLGWGIGIGIEQTRKQQAVWHWGSDDGFKAFTISYLDDQTGITIFTNGDNGYQVYKEILMKILDEPPHFVEHKSL